MSSSQNNNESGSQAGPDHPLVARPIGFLTVLSCLFLFGMMVVTFVDVVGRYLFLSPLPGGYEIVSLIMPAIIFFALPMSVLRNSHVTVDLLDGITPPRFHRVRAIVIDAICGVTLLMVSWRLVVRAQDQQRFQEVSDELVLELWPFSAAMAALCLISALVFFGKLIGHFKGQPTSGDRT